MADIVRIIIIVVTLAFVFSAPWLFWFTIPVGFVVFACWNTAVERAEHRALCRELREQAAARKAREGR